MATTKVSYICPDNIQQYVMLTQEFRVRRVAYEQFQLYWLATHGFSMRNILDLVREWSKELREDMLKEEDFSFEAFIDERGFGGSLYPCFREFLGAEFCVEDLMKLLLDKGQFSVWEKDPIVQAHKDADPAVITVDTNN